MIKFYEEKAKERLEEQASCKNSVEISISEKSKEDAEALLEEVEKDSQFDWNIGQVYGGHALFASYKKENLQASGPELYDFALNIIRELSKGNTDDLDSDVLFEKLFSFTENRDTSQLAASLGSKGGSSKSKAKKKASRENGKLGGRPRKNTPAVK